MKKSLTVVLSLAAGMALADRVVLTSGSHLTGTAGLIRAGKLQFKSDDLGDVQIDIVKIKSLDVEKGHVVRYADNSTEERVLGVRDGALWVDKDEKLDMSNVKETDPAAETWHGNVNVAFNAARGNTYDTSAAVFANLNRRWERDRLNLDFGYYYGEEGAVGVDTRKTADRWDVEGKHDHFWFPSVYHYENLKWERDVIQELNARYRVGGGGGYQWLDGKVFETTGKWNFNQELGVNWIKEEYAIHNDSSSRYGFCALRYGHHFSYIPKWAENLELFHTAEILPDVSEWDKILASADVGLSTKLIYDFDLVAKIEFEYNSKPADNRRKDDVRYIVGLGYKW